MKIGIIDLDTSHPSSWIPVERELGHEIVGVYDGGSIHPKGFAENFAREHNIPKVYDTPTAMVNDVDCVIIHGCDWDTHVEKARPFVEAGKAVLIDKPFAGNRVDLETIRKWATERPNGARVAGGSSLLLCNEVCAYRARPEEERGIPHTVFAGCGVDEFNYGIHAYALLSGLMGGGIRSVRHLGKRAQRTIEVNWHDGRVGYLLIGKQPKWLPFHATAVSDRNVTQLSPVPGDLYRAFLEALLPYLAGETDIPPVDPEILFEPELAALAALQSWENGDCEVALSDISPATRYDGAVFAASYRAARYGTP